MEQPADQNGNATGTNGGDGQQEEPKFTQAQVNQLITERLDREKKRSEEAKAKAEEEARAKALSEQGEFKKLSETQAQRIAELEAQLNGTGEKLATTEAQSTSYKTALEGYVKEQRKAVPAHIAELLDNMDLPKQLEWLTKNAATLTSPGLPAAPRANGNMGAANAEAARRQFERTVRNL